MQLDFRRYTWALKPPIFIRPLTDEERMQLEADRRTADAFRVRRAHIVLASARRRSPKPMAQLVGCTVQTVRNVIHTFHTQGVEGWAKQSNRPKDVLPRTFNNINACSLGTTRGMAQGRMPIMQIGSQTIYPIGRKCFLRLRIPRFAAVQLPGERGWTFFGSLAPLGHMCISASLHFCMSGTTRR